MPKVEEINVRKASEPKEETTEIKEQVSEAPTKPSQKQFEEVWARYVTLRKQDSNEIDVNTLENPVSYQDGIITIQLHQGLEEEIFKRLKIDLMQFLKKETGCSDLEIKTELQAASAKRMLYTAQEKFNFLAEKYPKLIELRQRLGLDMDF